MNKQVREAWQTGIEVLGLGERDLAHGLELHRHSLVFDAYGFMPRAAVDGAAIAAAMAAGASESELADLLEEGSMTRQVVVADEQAEFKAAWQQAGVTCVFQNAGEEGNCPLRLLKRLARFTWTTDMLRDFVPRAVTPDDIQKAHEQGHHCLYFTGNGVPVPEAAGNTVEGLGYIRLFFQSGIRMMHLTYNRRNLIGDGCAETANGGLSDFGRQVVGEMNRVGVIVDCAHTGWQSSLEAARLSRRPMVASHSVCAALNNHHRGKPDEVIKALCDTGGYIGICCIPAFLGRSGDLTALLDHIDYGVKTFGADHVAIGTDVAYTSTAMAGEQAKIPPRRRQRPRWENFWPADDPLYDPCWQLPRQSLSMAWTNWPLFTAGLVQRGYRDDDIQKIIGGNVMRVAREVFPG
jgi:membrane dipeptidase